MSYLRIGTGYYKIVNVPMANGSKTKQITKWSRQNIIDDNSKDYLTDIDKYDGFTVIPSHSDYKQTIDGFYNLYNPLSHKNIENVKEDDIPYSIGFLKHIFEDQFNLGLDYLSILYQYPMQILPILCLVSEERNTGKTTFLNLMSWLFEDNTTFIRNADISSRFNNDWSNKLIIAVDEVYLDKAEDTERIKCLATAKQLKEEGKGKDKVAVDFFGKLIFCSNKVHNFIRIDESETRFWVREIKTLEKYYENFESKLKYELPYLISYIANRKISTPSRSRMWFKSDDIKTSALNKLKYHSKATVEKEIISFLKDRFDTFEVETLKYCNAELIEALNNYNVRINTGHLSHILEDKWKLKSTNSSYLKYYLSRVPGSNKMSVQSEQNKGRYYTFEKEFIYAIN